MMRSWKGKFDLQGAYNIDAARMIKPAMGDIPLMLVGGLRSVAQMEEVLKTNYVDFISICRPLIREPFLVRKIKEGRTDAAACVSCNRCFAAVANDILVGCYYKKFPYDKIRLFAN